MVINVYSMETCQHLGRSPTQSQAEFPFFWQLWEVKWGEYVFISDDFKRPWTNCMRASAILNFDIWTQYIELQRYEVDRTGSRLLFESKCRDVIFLCFLDYHESCKLVNFVHQFWPGRLFHYQCRCGKLWIIWWGLGFWRWSYTSLKGWQTNSFRARNAFEIHTSSPCDRPTA